MNSPDTIAQLLGRLSDLGLYRFDTDEVATRAKSQALLYGWPFAEPTIRGPYQADAEDLTEGDAAELLTRLAPFLETQGLNLRSTEQQLDETGYGITVDDRRFDLYSGDETEKDDLWDIVMRRFLAATNMLLRNTGSNERAYLLYGGNDAAIVFLTPEMFTLLKDTPIISELDKPVRADGV